MRIHPASLKRVPRQGLGLPLAVCVLTLALGFAPSASFAASAMAQNLRGQMEDGALSFAGTLNDYNTGHGELEFAFGDGVACSGEFVYAGLRWGKGVVTCSNSRSGTFEIISMGTRGSGSGAIAGVPFTFTFGE